ncbi:23S rRNA (adenine(2030)-N(6))-methyltransferase RlmJ [Pseudoxanthomonas broegbernensis]|uniref:Ribosomal RNA large subunit methyltransferase J n=1 Tax=Pseudoxanthomonas broegbernensis TaxID=83619 RepID=A0A7V8GQ27_9GAMM|nr:23S rRNA (adenine(2030)-N(6))-methyltransferase RlmJ [Pseudoxanthomonas broegbernensis]KAF1688105.1 23S rRNA (adenine(2030)-N(6))-methyltransferase RlmJ [Pseudoxanthomonas broegbernensis]
MNYRHAFHAGNHADVLKHVVLLALIDALRRKDAPFFVLDTHAGRGRYLLQGKDAGRTGEAAAGILALAGAKDPPAAVARYLHEVAADNPVDALLAYPGSPLLAARAMRDQDRLAACELQPEEAAELKALFVHDPRVAVHARDGYGAVRALLPPRVDGLRYARGLVLVDPPYEAQDAEYPLVAHALREALERWPQATCAAWYPVKQRRSLLPFFRKLEAMPARSALLAELLVRPDDSPLRLNGSGMAILNPPWKLDEALAPALPFLQRKLGEAGASTRLEWLKREAR